MCLCVCFEWGGVCLCLGFVGLCVHLCVVCMLVVLVLFSCVEVKGLALDLEEEDRRKGSKTHMRTHTPIHPPMSTTHTHFYYIHIQIGGGRALGRHHRGARQRLLRELDGDGTRVFMYVCVCVRACVWYVCVMGLARFELLTWEFDGDGKHGSVLGCCFFVAIYESRHCDMSCAVESVTLTL